MSRRALAVACGFAAALHVLAWGFVTPPFHVPDEVSHYAYVETLAERGRLPADQPGVRLSPSEEATLELLNFFEVVGEPDDKPPRSMAVEARLRALEAAPPPAFGTGEALTAAGNPPLYYLAQAAVYEASPWDTVLDRLALMRILSALLAGVTGACLALFVCEALPGSPWAARGGALAGAFQPMFGFISGGLNPDALLFTASALLLWLAARALRHGLTLRRALAIGGAVAAGLLAKPIFAAFVPAALLAVALAAWRSPGGRRALVPAAAAVVVALVPFALYRTLDDGWRVPQLGPAEAFPEPQLNLREMLAYVWQLYLPRLSFLEDQIPGYPGFDLWFSGLVGRFGWLDHGFPRWVSQWAIAPAATLALLAAWTLVRERRAVLGRWREGLVYAVAAATLLGGIGVVGYGYRQTHPDPLEQARYLLPLLPLYSLGIALALRRLGAGWGPPAAAAVSVLAAGHASFAMLLSVARYYG